MFPRVLQQPVTGIDPQLLTDGIDHPVHFRFEISRIVDHVEIRMSNPSRRGFVIQLAGQVDPFAPANVVLCRIKFLGAVCRGNLQN